jgi:hypothetical protein
MAPAIALAADGYPISLRHARVLEAWKGMGLAARFPETAAIQRRLVIRDELQRRIRPAKGARRAGLEYLAQQLRRKLDAQRTEPTSRRR